MDIVLAGEQGNDQIIPMHHAPSWKLRKNPFWRIGSGAVVPTNEHGTASLFAYEASQDVSGKVILSLPPGKKADHLGIKIQFIGRIDMVSGDRRSALQCCFPVSNIDRRVMEFMKVAHTMISFPFPRNFLPQVVSTSPAQKYPSISRTWTRSTSLIQGAM